MAMNYAQMLGSLKLGPDILPTTDPDSVPHVFQAGYVPVYTVRNDAGDVVIRDKGVDQLVHEAHGGLEALTLYEDEYPVFTVY